MRQCAEVAIVGAGLAGLAAALALLETGRDVVVLEAAGRTGGRIARAWAAPGLAVDLGGAAVGAFHSRIRTLCALWAVQLAPARACVDEEGLPGRIVLDGVTLSASRRKVLARDLESIIGRCVDAMGGPSVSEDLRSIGSVAWLRRQAGNVDAVRCFSDLPDGAQSAWALLCLLRGAGGPDFFRSAEAHFAPGGMYDLVSRMTRSLGPGRVLTRTQVVTIRVGRRHVELQARGPAGDVVALHAEAVVLAVPPAGLARIAGAPEAATLLGRLTANREIVSLLRPGARLPNQELSALTDSNPRIAVVRPHPANAERMLLSATVRADGPRAEAPVADIIRAAAELLMLAPQDVGPPLERRWTRAAGIGGSYGAIPPGHGVAECDETATFGRIVLASDMLCPRFAGYMEGAIRSGHAAAVGVQRILANGARSQ